MKTLMALTLERGLFRQAAELISPELVQAFFDAGNQPPLQVSATCGKNFINSATHVVRVQPVAQVRQAPVKTKIGEKQKQARWGAGGILVAAAVCRQRLIQKHRKRQVVGNSPERRTQRQTQVNRLSPQSTQSASKHPISCRLPELNL